MPQTPAGWHPDPYPPRPGQPPMLRYWDGHVWTGHVHPATQTVAPPRAVAAPPAPTTPDGQPLAEWWQRLCGYLVDSAVLSVPIWAVLVPLLLSRQSQLADLTTRLDRDLRRSAQPPNLLPYVVDSFEILVPLFIGLTITTFVVWATYSTLMLRFKSATLGMIALGISVRLRERPGRLPWSTIFVRVLVQQGVLLTGVFPLLYLALSWFPYLDALWLFWDDQRRTLHDKAAKTNVVLRSR